MLPSFYNGNDYIGVKVTDGNFQIRNGFSNDQEFDLSLLTFQLLLKLPTGIGT